MLRWTAPGDDANEGQAASYEIRYSTSLVTAESFPTATLIPGTPTPGSSGDVDSVVVEGLLSGQSYYFALRSIDEAGNLSVLSNVDSLNVSGPPDTTAPAAVSDLRVLAVNGNSVTLGWTASGDDELDGRASQYELRYSAEPLTDTTWPTAHTIVGVPEPESAGHSETFTARELVPGTIIHFALLVRDEAGNPSSLSNTVSQEMPRSDHVWWVYADGFGDAPTIQAAIDSASDGDTVAIGAGTYDVTLSIQHKSLTLLGWGGSNKVTLTKPALNPINLLASILDSEDRLHIEGVNFEGARVQGWSGAAINVLEAGTLHLKSCRFKSNSASDNYMSAGHGGAIFIRGDAHLIAEDCEFTSNSATPDLLRHQNSSGGAIWAKCQSVRLSRCTFRNNVALGESAANGGALLLDSDEILVEDCEFMKNRANFGASISSIGNLHLARNRFIDNSNLGGTRNTYASKSGVVNARNGLLAEDCTFVANVFAGAALLVVGDGDVRIRGCTFAFNQARDTRTTSTLEIAADVGVSVEIRQTLISSNLCGGIRHNLTNLTGVSCNIISGNTMDFVSGIDFREMNNNSGLDPRFCEPASMSLTVASDSPCLAGSQTHPTACGRIGVVVAGCDSPLTHAGAGGLVRYR